MLGAGTGFIGKVSNDFYGNFFRDSLLERGTEANLLLSTTLPSGVASTFISPDGERTFGTYLGAASTLKAEDLSLDMFKGYAYLFIEGYLVQDHDMILRAIELAKEAGLQVCLDMASYNIVEGDLEFFSLLVNKYVDIVFANEEEAKAFTGKEPEEALDIIAKMCSIAIVKVGARGSLIRKGTEMVQVGCPWFSDSQRYRDGAGTSGSGRESGGHYRSWRLFCGRFLVWTDVWLLAGEMWQDRLPSLQRCDTSGGYGASGSTMGKNQGRNFIN